MENIFCDILGLFLRGGGGDRELVLHTCAFQRVHTESQSVLGL